MSSSFHELGLLPELVETVNELGYREPTPIQMQAIPALLAGRDVLGQSQTGTGKTAAYTLPMLQRLDYNAAGVQALVMTPTRELAIQVAEAVFRYGHLLGIRVLPIYGGQSYTRQTRRLERGIHLVVGTPGRILDLIRQKALDLSGVHYLVLDEADEMLKMGFIDDVEAILGETDSQTRLTALFSATLPSPIRRLADRYMHDPLPLTIEHKTLTVENIAQRYYLVYEQDKLAALTRLLELEALHNILIFTRTKAGAAELAEALYARGYPAEALHGDLTQAARETVMRRFRGGQITMLVATDVAARGIDIPDVSHVINYDIPMGEEDYVHRIGRTARAGRAGDAITLVTPKERHSLKAIEGYTRQTITRAKLPTPDEIHAHRATLFGRSIINALETEPLEEAYTLLSELVQQGFSAEEVAAATIRLARAQELRRPIEHVHDVHESEAKGARKRSDETPRPRPARRNGMEQGMVRLYLNIGSEKGIRPGDIVYAIASEASIPGKAIGAIEIQREGSFVDVNEEHVETVLRVMGAGKIRGIPVTLARAASGAGAKSGKPYPKKPRAGTVANPGGDVGRHAFKKGKRHE